MFCGIEQFQETYKPSIPADKSPVLPSLSELDRKVDVTTVHADAPAGSRSSPPDHQYNGDSQGTDNSQSTNPIHER
jgi:hypothetical protein